MGNTDIVALQNKILKIAVYLDEFCKKYDITYYLMGGSALGAVRHQSFIPWDDDYDVFMTYDNYLKFIDECKTNIDAESFYLQEENTKEWPMFFTKLRMNGTTFIEPDTKNRKMHKGVYVDVMCLNNVSDNRIYRYLQYICARLITAETLGQRGYITDSKKKKVVIFFSKLFIRGVVKKALIGFVRSLNNVETKDVGHFFGKARFKHTSFPRDYLGIPKYIKFSTAFLPVPEKVEKYLTLRFGDYMKMPDEKTKSEYPIHAEFVDLDRDYSNYEKS